MANAKKKAKAIHCNLRQIGLGLMLYANEFEDQYPVHKGWGDLGGIRGNDGGESQSSAPFTPVDERPLNDYAGDPQVFRCPGDKGDSFRKLDNCFLGYGNNYLTMWAVDIYRVKHVTGDSNRPNSQEGTPLKSSGVALAPGTIIMQGDWNWFLNRDKNDPRSIWHNFKAQHRNNILFGDNHVEYFRFPEDANLWNGPPSVTNKWW